MLAYIAIAIYSGAVWVLFALALARARRAIQTGAQTPLSTAIRYLHGHYERRVFYWELIELLRRLVLVGILLIAPGQGTIEQLAIGTLVAVVYLGVQAIASPFRKPSDDFFATACSMLLAALFVCSLLFKVSLHPSARFQPPLARTSPPAEHMSATDARRSTRVLLLKVRGGDGERPDQARHDTRAAQGLPLSLCAQRPWVARCHQTGALLTDSLTY